MQETGHLIQYFLVGCLVVLCIMHAGNFATAVGAVGGQVTKAGGILTGQA